MNRVQGLLHTPTTMLGAITLLTTIMAAVQQAQDIIHSVTEVTTTIPTSKCTICSQGIMIRKLVGL